MQLLQESEQKYHWIVENANVVIVVVQEGRLKFFNRKTLEATGYAAQELTTTYFAEFIYPKDRELMIERHLRRLSGEPVPSVYPFRIVDKTGQVKRVESHTVLIPWDGKPATLSFLTDITERRQLEEQYHHAQKMEAVGRLTAGVAHDFNNLLTTINGFAALIQAELWPDDPRWEMTDIIIRSGQRAANLTRQLLAFSRKQIIQPQVLNLNSVVVELSKMLQRVIGEDIDLKTSLAPELWPVKVDPVQIDQVILNLVVNARDAMPTGGQLTIETANVVIDDNYVADHLESQPGKYVLLAISDTGCGMSPEVKARIFEPFFTTKERGHGTGLGLATVFGIVKQSGGNIWVYSEEGLGTTFKIYFPHVEEKVMGLSALLEPKPERPPGWETILLVEDDLGVRELLRRVLPELGYTLLEAGNGQEALRLLAHYPDPIHLLLTDVVMPGISGKALAEALLHNRPDLKLLFMSGYTDETIVQHGVLGAGVAFIQKPFSPVTLAAKLRSVLDNLPDSSIHR